MNRRRAGSLTLLTAVCIGLSGMTAGSAQAATSPPKSEPAPRTVVTSGLPYCWQVPIGWIGLCKPGLPWF